MPRTFALLLLTLAIAAPAQAQSPPPWLAAFRDYCIPFVQGRSLAAVEVLVGRAGYPVTKAERGIDFVTPAGQVNVRQYGDRRLCEVQPPRTIDYPTLQRDLGAWLKTAPDGPYVVTDGPGPNVEQSRYVVWKGPRYQIQINEEMGDEGIYLFVEAATPR